MLTMPEINSIKCLRNDNSLSINTIAKTHNINWRTAKKYADGEQLPKEIIKKRKEMMYEERWGEMVADWLLEDQKLKKKSRRTNKQLLVELKKKGFPGSYRTVCNFIQECLFYGMKKIFEQLGGIYSIAAVTDHFIDSLAEDPVIGKKNTSNTYLKDWYENKSWRAPGFKVLNTIWICEKAGGPDKYVSTIPNDDGLDLEPTHYDMKLTGEEFYATGGVLAN